MLSSGSTNLLIFGSVVLGVVVAINARIAWAAVTACDEGIYVANCLTSYKLKWSDIERFELGQFWLIPDVCLIYTTRGKRRGATAVHGGGYPSSRSGKWMVEELTQELQAERKKELGKG